MWLVQGRESLRMSPDSSEIGRQQDRSCFHHCVILMCTNLIVKFYVEENRSIFENLMEFILWICSYFSPNERKT